MKRKIAPINAKDARGMQGNNIPDAVIEAFNELILKNLHNHTAIVKQKDVVALIVKKGIRREDIFENHWLDVEGLFAEYGWKVKYDKPGWDESYDPFFIFDSR